MAISSKRRPRCFIMAKIVKLKPGTGSYSANRKLDANRQKHQTLFPGPMEAQLKN